MTPDLAIVVSTRAWAEDLHRFVADHGGARVRARVLDGREALEEDYDVLVVDDITSFVTPRLVADVQRAGRRVLGVYDDAEPFGEQRLRELGVDAVAVASDTAEELLTAATLLAETLDLDGALARLVAPAADGGDDAGAAEPRGRRVAVGGPAGGCGATEVAIGLAAAVGAVARAVIVDADTVGPAIAQRLGLPLHPNLRTAIDASRRGRFGLPRELARTIGPDLAVLTGIPAAADWAAARADDVAAVVEDLATAADAVVVDVGHRLESLPTGFGAPERYDTPRRVVASADVVVAVLAGTPVGVRRGLDWLADVRALTGAAPVHVVVNRAPSASFRRGEVHDELTRSFTPASLRFVPDDRRVTDAAWDGLVVRTGTFARAMDGLAAELLNAPHGIAA